MLQWAKREPKGGFMIFDFEKILDRVAHIMETDNGEAPYDKDIASYLKISPSSLANMKRRGGMPLKELTLFAAERKVSINWLLFGQHIRDPKEVEDHYRISFLADITGSAGGGAVNEDELEREWLTLDSHSVEALGLREHDLEHIEAIRVTGDSMEPKIMDGSIILIDREKTDVTGGGIFAVNVSGNVFIKRIVLNSSGKVELISTNPDYNTTYEQPEDVMVIGKVIGSLEKV